VAELVDALDSKSSSCFKSESSSLSDGTTYFKKVFMSDEVQSLQPDETPSSNLDQVPESPSPKSTSDSEPNTQKKRVILVVAALLIITLVGVLGFFAASMFRGDSETEEILSAHNTNVDIHNGYLSTIQNSVDRLEQLLNEVTLTSDAEASDTRAEQLQGYVDSGNEILESLESKDDVEELKSQLVDGPNESTANFKITISEAMDAYAGSLIGLTEMVNYISCVSQATLDSNALQLRLDSLAEDENATNESIFNDTIQINNDVIANYETLARCYAGLEFEGVTAVTDAITEITNGLTASNGFIQELLDARDADQYFVDNEPRFNEILDGLDASTATFETSYQVFLGGLTNNISDLLEDADTKSQEVAEAQLTLISEFDLELGEAVELVPVD
jgi:hypothetical protein